MLTGVKKIVKAMPPFNALLRERDRLAGEVHRLQVQVDRHNSFGDPSYEFDGLRTYHKNLSFLRDAQFQNAYRAGVATGHKVHSPEDIHIEYRAHIVCWAAQHATHLPGDFVECGVNRGCLSVTLCNYIDFNKTGKRFYLFDTFQGVPDEQMTSAERGSLIGRLNGLYEECYEIAKRNFAPFPRAHLVRGMIPDTLTSVPIEKVCYLSIDMNIVAPEIAAMEFFWPKLVSGGIVILDDYGWNAHYAQKNALDAFAKKCGVSIATLPTGQGLLLKP